MPHTTIADMKKTKEFAVVGKKLKRMIETARREGERVFVFAARRGIAGTTVCRDCGELARCAKCEHPLALHAVQGGNALVCHRCGETRRADTRCAQCGGWRLVALGIGIERVEQALAEMFPKAALFRLDADVAKTDTKAMAVVREWRDTPGGILLGTERSLSFFDTVPYTAVASLDALFAVPDFRMNERVFRLVRALAEKTGRELLVQTRAPEADALRRALAGDTDAFYTEELALRKQFNNPPFSILLKITAPKNLPEEARRALTDALKRFPVYPLPEGSGALVKVSREKWPDRALVETLRALAPAAAVDVSPADL